MESITICVKCNFFKKRGVIDAWYNKVCTARKKHKALDPVSGKRRYVEGIDSFTDDPYFYCKDINKGDCKYFQKKTIPQKIQFWRGRLQ